MITIVGGGSFKHIGAYRRGCKVDCSSHLLPYLCMRRRVKAPSVETVIIIVAVGLGFGNYRVVMFSETVGMSMIAARIERIRVVKILAADTETAKMEGKIVKM